MEDFKPIEIGGKSIENRILIGLAAITATIILVGWIAINENPRMDEFTERASARSIEQGARVYETNCTGCHGDKSYGANGVAPAFNSPTFFGFSFFSEIDQQILVIDSELTSATGDERATLQAQRGELEAERLALEEKILYDYSHEMAGFEEQLAALDEQIVSELEGVGTGGRLPSVIDRFKTAQLTPLEDEQTALEEAIKAASPVPSADNAAATGADDTATTAEATTAETGTDSTASSAETASETGTESAETAGDDTTAAEAEVAVDCSFLQGDDRKIDTVVAQVVDQTNLDQLNARLAEVEAALAEVKECLAPYEALATTRSNLSQKQGRFQALTDAQAAVLQARADLAAAESDLAALPTLEADATDPNAEERLALTTASTEARTALSTAESTRDAAYEALVTAGDIVAYDPNGDTRLEQVKWPGSLEDYVEGTLIGGRPTSAGYWPNPMAAWAQSSGGPLRPDQIKNLTDYILNYGLNWTHERPIDDMIAELRQVKQFARIPNVGAASAASDDAVGADEVAIQTEIAARLEAGELIAGDPIAGELAFSATGRGCAGCHGPANGTGPASTGLWTRATSDQDGRLTATGHVDNPEAYIIQSIVNPGAFTVPGFASGLMPSDWGERLSYQELADILAYLETQE